MELKQVLLDHARRYPRMEPADAVKLIYQSEFGGGHMIRDRESCLNYLRREYASVEKDPCCCPAVDIGNGLVRAELAALPEEKLEALGDAFIRSANAHKGSLPRFLEKLTLLRELTGAGIFGFGTAALDAYLADYAEAGYPAVSHSEQYRNAYHPAYRVVRKADFPGFCTGL